MDPDSARIAAIELVQSALTQELPKVPDEVRHHIRRLPVVPKEELPLEDSCPICFTTFENLVAEYEDLNVLGFWDCLANEGDEKGVTKLDVCGHIFCRKDLGHWIRTRHTSCPTCRSQCVPDHILVLLKGDDESSDGGEYLPPSEDDDQDDYDPDWDDHDILEDFVDSDSDEWLPSPAFRRLISARVASARRASAFSHASDDDVEMSEHGSDGVENIYDPGAEAPETRTDGGSFEVEWGLTDGESNQSRFSSPTDEAGFQSGGILLDVRVQVSADEGETQCQDSIAVVLPEDGVSK